MYFINVSNTIYSIKFLYVWAIIGNIVDSPYEYVQSASKADFILFTEEWSYTDDAIYTVAIPQAAWLLLVSRRYLKFLMNRCVK